MGGDGGGDALPRRADGERRRGEDGAKTELGTWTAERSFDDTTGTAGVEYWYFVKAATGADGAHATGWSEGAKGMKKPVKTLTGLAVSGPDRVGSGERAVYACEASWNDGEKRPVAAEWSAVGGEIGGDGGFTAVETENDVAGRVVAAYGGMAATQEVTIVGTAIEARASVTDVAAVQRWPFGGVVDIDYTLETAPAGTKAVVSVGAWDEDHGRALAARSLAGDGADGTPVEAGTHRVSWNLSADYPGLHAAGVRVEVGAVVASLAAPVVTAKGRTNEKWIQLDWDAVDGVVQYQLLRGTSDNVAVASTLATLSGCSYRDASVQYMATYYYWVVANAGSLSSTSEVITASISIDLMPLKSLLVGLDYIDDDGVISDDEIAGAFNNPTIGGGIDGLPGFSDDEMDVLLRIQALNEDKALIDSVIRDNYADIPAAVMDELVAVSDKIVAIKQAANFVPRDVTASQGNGTLSARVAVRWTKPSANESPLTYEVYRGTSSNGTDALVATVTTTNWTDTDVTFRKGYWYRVRAVFASQTGDFSGRVMGYWGDWWLDGVYRDLMPLKSLLRGLDFLEPDGVIDDNEMNRAFKNPTIGGGIDGDPSSISADELDILTRIDALRRADWTIFDSVIRDDFTYRGITEAVMVELQSISDKIKGLENY